jgi:hypothetical protein
MHFWKILTFNNAWFVAACPGLGEVHNTQFNYTYYHWHDQPGISKLLSESK